MCLIENLILYFTSETALSVYAILNINVKEPAYRKKLIKNMREIRFI